MKLTIDLYDASQRADALNILALFDQPEEEEVSYLPEDAPAVDPVEVKAPAAPAVPKVSLDPTPTAAPEVEPAPTAAPEVEPAPTVTAKDVQDLAMELNKAGQINREDLITRLASYGGAEKISALDEAQLASFHAQLLNLRGEANV